jgi:hypothetical protein
MWRWICIVLTMNVASSFNTWMQSSSVWGSFGKEYQPTSLGVLLLELRSTESLTRCALSCHSNQRCRTMDHDQNTKQCRLFQGDLTTGQIISSSSSTSRVGFIQFSPEKYFSYNQSCNQCENNRNLLCQNLICQCPPETFWSGTLCRPQLFLGANCSRTEMCRQALNYTCSSQTYQCTTGMSHFKIPIKR